MEQQVWGSRVGLPEVNKSPSTSTVQRITPRKGGYVVDNYRPTLSEINSMINSLGEHTHSQSDYAKMVFLCGEHRALSQGRRVHAHVLQNKPELDLYLGNNIVKMYLKCRCLREAREALESMVQTCVVIWTEVISEHVKHKEHREALKLFRKMLLWGVSPNKITFLEVLNTCVSLHALEEVHERICNAGFESNPMVATTLIHRYSEFSCSGKVREVFDRVHKPDVYLYNVMISAYAKHEGHEQMAMYLFWKMQMEGFKPEKVTFLAVMELFPWDPIDAHVKLVHGMILEAGLESDLEISTGLISMYSKCNSLSNAVHAFEKTTQRDMFLYSAIAEAHAHCGCIRKSLSLIHLMQQEGFKPSKITFVAVTVASAGRATRDEATLIHQAVVASGFDTEGDVSTSLVNMYVKCGRIHQARCVFNGMGERKVITWTSMISGYTLHGHVSEALRLFKEMQLEGFVPSLVTFLCVLSACSHVGMLAEGHLVFVSMAQDYVLLPGNAHYGCLVDLLGRSGLVYEAEEFLKKMPLEPDAEAWMALLRACRDRDDVQVGHQAGERLLELEPGWEAGYVVLSGVYATSPQQPA